MWRGGFDMIFWRKPDGSFPEFDAHIAGLHWTQWRPSFIVLHNTGSPSEKQWKGTPGGEMQRLKNVETGYKYPPPKGRGWNSGPHFFCSYDAILRGTPATVIGTHSPSYNAHSLGIEMTGDFRTGGDPFDPLVRDTTVHCLAVLHAALGLQPDNFKLGVRGLHLHKEDRATTHDCPGNLVDKADVIKRVHAAIAALHPGEHQAPV